jgi:hypothetical protein
MMQRLRVEQLGCKRCSERERRWCKEEEGGFFEVYYETQGQSLFGVGQAHALTAFLAAFLGAAFLAAAFLARLGAAFLAAFLGARLGAAAFLTVLGAATFAIEERTRLDLLGIKRDRCDYTQAKACLPNVKAHRTWPVVGAKAWLSGPSGRRGRRPVGIGC